jgi:hypothetical protein
MFTVRFTDQCSGLRMGIGRLRVIRIIGLFTILAITTGIGRGGQLIGLRRIGLAEATIGRRQTVEGITGLRRMVEAITGRARCLLIRETIGLRVMDITNRRVVGLRGLERLPETGAVITVRAILGTGG